MSNKRATTVGILTAGIAASILATTVGPAAAQGNPVGGKGNAYFLSGALNTTGVAQQVYAFGNVDDQVYYGDWYGTGTDTPMVRRGNIYYVQSKDGKTTNVFAYGEANDEVLVGNWDGATNAGLTDDSATTVDESTFTVETDSLAVRRGNHFFVKNDSFSSGKADSEFFYGDAGDKVLVGNWDGQTTAAGAAVDRAPLGVMDPAVPAHAPDLKPILPHYDADGKIDNGGDPGFDANKNGVYEDGDRAPGTGVDNNGDGDFDDITGNVALPADHPAGPGKGDTIMIQRGNQFFVKNSISTGIADYTFYYGDAGDTVLVGDWATPATPKTGNTAATAAKPAMSADGADQLAVRRGNIYFSSTELEAAHTKKTNPTASRVFAFGDAADTVFVASLPSKAVDAYGADQADNPATATVNESIITGDGLGVRR